MQTTQTTDNAKRVRWILNGLEQRGIDFEIASTYGEPGYSTDKPFIVLADWNEPKHKGGKREYRAFDLLETEWQDEWITDSENRAFRCSPDCYGWQASWFYHDGEVVPYDESDGHEGADLLEWLDGYGFVHNNGDSVELKAVPSCISPERLSPFAELVRDDMETGFHPGQNDRPEKFLKTAPEGRYLFRIQGKGQFEIRWEVYRVKEEQE